MIYNSCMCQKKLMIHQLDKKKISKNWLFSDRHLYIGSLKYFLTFEHQILILQ